MIDRGFLMGVPIVLIVESVTILLDGGVWAVMCLLVVCALFSGRVEGFFSGI